MKTEYIHADSLDSFLDGCIDDMTAAVRMDFFLKLDEKYVPCFAFHSIDASDLYDESKPHADNCRACADFIRSSYFAMSRLMSDRDRRHLHFSAQLRRGADVIISPALPEDADAVLKLDEHITPERLLRSISQGLVYTARHNGGGICAVLRYGLFWDSVPFMYMLYVDAAERGKGIGKALAGRWERDMRDSGFSSVMTSTQSDEYAQHFYAHLGYSAAGGFITDDGAYEIIMKKILSICETQSVE